jgi:hypothetical protein
MSATPLTTQAQDQKDQKRLEKIAKQIKPFLDEKKDAKQRVKLLVQFIENSTESPKDTDKVFQENCDYIQTFLLETFNNRVKKCRGIYFVL